MNVFKMGWRNVLRNKRRSAVTITAMTLALWVLLLYAGFVPGYMKDMEEGVTELEIGDLQIHAPGYLESPSLYTAMEDSDAIVQQLEEAGIAASPRLLGGGLGASGEFSAGVQLRGIDVQRDREVSRLWEAVGEGEWLDPADPQGVVLGKHLAKTLNVKPGDELIVVGQAADGSLANDLYNVRGVLEAVGQRTDRGGVLMNAATFREFMSLPTGVHQIVLRRGERDLGDAAAEARQIVRDPFEEFLALLAPQNLGQLVVQHEDYLDTHDPGLTVEDVAALQALVLENEHVTRVAPRVLGALTVSVGETSVEAGFIAYDPALEQVTDEPSADPGVVPIVTLPLLEGELAGEALASADSDALVLGKSLADKLGVKVGDEVAYSMLGKDGVRVDTKGTLAATLVTGVDGVDATADLDLVLLPLGTARQVLGYGADEASHLCLMLDAPLNAGLTSLAISPKLDRGLDIMASAVATPGPSVQTWKQLMPAVAQMFQSVEGMIWVFYLIVYVAVAILILNAMLTAVFERIREFGVLKAIGAGPIRVSSLIMVEGAVQAAVASVVGLTLALPFMWYLQTHGINTGAMAGTEMVGLAVSEIWYGIYSVESCTGPLFLLWFLTMAAVLYPALKAAWINPIRAMRYGPGGEDVGLFGRVIAFLFDKLPLLDRLCQLFIGKPLELASKLFTAVLPWLATIAWRNLWRQKRRTVLTLVSIAFGLFMAILMMAMQDMTFAGFIDTAARQGSGHVVVHHHEYLDTPSLGRTVQGTADIHALARQDERVERVVDRIMGEAMVATARDSFGAAFIAYDPQAETDDTLRFLEGVVSGEMYTTADDQGIVLGKVLAKNLDAELGDKIVYTMMDKDGEIVAGMGRLSGTIGTGAPSADAALFLLPLDTARETLGYEADEATHVGVYLSDNRNSADVAAALGAKLAAGLNASSWGQVAPDLRTFVVMKLWGGRFFLVIIALLVTAGIFNTLFMSVMERVREFGILVAVGYSPSQIFCMITWESIFLAIVGLAAGLAISASPYKWLSENGIDMSAMYANQDVSVGGVGFDMVMPCGLYPETFIIIVCCVVFATLAAGLYPAWKAGHVEPVDSIKLV